MTVTVLTVKRKPPARRSTKNPETRTTVRINIFFERPSIVSCFTSGTFFSQRWQMQSDSFPWCKIVYIQCFKEDMTSSNGATESCIPTNVYLTTRLLRTGVMDVWNSVQISAENMLTLVQKIYKKSGSIARNNIIGVNNLHNILLLPITRVHWSCSGACQSSAIPLSGGNQLIKTLQALIGFLGQAELPHLPNSTPLFFIQQWGRTVDRSNEWQTLRTMWFVFSNTHDVYHSL